MGIMHMENCSLWHGDAVMKMTGVELGHKVELEHGELHKSF